MKIIAQAMEVKDGSRSETLNTTTEELANILERVCGDKKEEVAVLILMDQTKEEGEWNFSRAPHMSADKFIEFFKKPEEQENA